MKNVNDESAITAILNARETDRKAGRVVFAKNTAKL